jgi:DNA-directed RNA polymerase specialized sigma24 family protein
LEDRSEGGNHLRVIADTPIKKFLFQVYDYSNRIDEAIERIERIKSKAERVTTVLSDMPHGERDPHSMERTIAQYIDLADELEDEMKQYTKVSKAVSDAIETLTDDYEKRVLRLRYLNFYEWAQIAEKMGYEVRSATRLHGEALQKLSITVHQNCDKV